jgi:phosphopantetheinyl transferase
VSSDGATASPEVSRSTAAQAAKSDTARWCFLDRVLEHRRDQHLLCECELDVETHRFLQDHTFFGRGLSVQDPALRALPIMPLAMTLEMMAEAAMELRPRMRVAALSQIVTSRWLAFETPTRRVRIAATVESETCTRVRVMEADGEGMNAQIAEALVEHSHEPPDLGPPTLPRVDGPPPTWDPEDLYGPILYHGPAFQGIETIDKCGPDGLLASLRTPDPELLFSGDDGRTLVLPAVLIDTASQIPGVANFGKRHADGLVTLAFPNTADRVEFATGATASQRLTATVRYNVDDRYLRSDVEFTAADGQVVLRYLGRVEEIVHFPLQAYAYPSNPRTQLCSREITELFHGVPGIQQCTMTEVDGIGHHVLVNRLWSEVLARMVLSRSERDAWQSIRRPPVHAVTWLLGRIVGKDAVRIHNALDVCLADVTIQSEPGGKPVAVLAEGPAPNISITHKGFYAAAVASRSLRGVGIDVEPLQELDPGVIADAFDRREREILESIPAGYVAAWTAKEAIGKALGRGLAGRPRCVKIVSAVPEQHGVEFAAVLEGSMAGVFLPDTRAGGNRESLRAYCRIHGEHVLSLCLLQEGE